jgi:hypothetical protein
MMMWLRACLSMTKPKTSDEEAKPHMPTHRRRLLLMPLLLKPQVFNKLVCAVKATDPVFIASLGGLISLTRY